MSALELEQIPESLLVVGAGPVGLEFAQIFARFGSRVTIVNHGPQIAARADAEAAAELQAALEDEGIEVDPRRRRRVVRARGRSHGRHASLITSRGHPRPARVRTRAQHRGVGARRVPASRPIAATSSSTTASARTSTESGRSATSPSGRSSRPPRSTRRGSRSTTCSASVTGAPTTRRCRRRSSPIRSSAPSVSPSRRHAMPGTTSTSSSIRCRTSRARSTRARSTGSSRSSSTPAHERCSASTSCRATRATSSAASRPRSSSA